MYSFWIDLISVEVQVCLALNVLTFILIVNQTEYIETQLHLNSPRISFFDLRHDVAHPSASQRTHEGSSGFFESTLSLAYTDEDGYSPIGSTVQACDHNCPRPSCVQSSGAEWITFLF